MAERDSMTSAAADAIDQGQEAAREGLKMARDYADSGLDAAAELSENMGEFVKREPLMALLGAFAVGFVVAHILRRLTR